ncbi:MAG: malate synthase A [Thaumarchaeota archaeon]|nr:malate synthase A [Nitrososphaerota archaeon]
MEILGNQELPNFSEVLTDDALELVVRLHRQFSEQREKLLQQRKERQKQFDLGLRPNFLAETAEVRNSDWRVGSIPKDLMDRRVEITGPSGDTKMVINAFNSGANVYMADFEDAQSPTWENTIQGQINMSDAVERKIAFKSPEGKDYKLNEKIATLIVRPRGWHLLEKHVLVDGQPVSASLFDFSLFFFHNARKLLNAGSGPYYYLPKLESHLEARLWNEVFSFAEKELGLPTGTIKATVLIETIAAAFEMDEILYELRDHMVGLNCGRWDYIFSFIKKFGKDPSLVLPERSQVTMDKAFLAAYVALLIKTCHRRGASAIGGMSASIPVKNDERANQIAFENVRKDKEREVRAGHDGTWVAHPGLVSVAKEVFDRGMKGQNQLSNLREDVHVTPGDLLRVHEGTITESGLRTNISVGIQYIEAWLGGKGSVPINNLMEDAATAEICRAQLWQWITDKSNLTDGRVITSQLCLELVTQELEKIRKQIGDARYNGGHFERARTLFEDLLAAKTFPEFLTLKAYDELLSLEQAANN